MDINETGSISKALPKTSGSYATKYVATLINLPNNHVFDKHLIVLLPLS